MEGVDLGHEIARIRVHKLDCAAQRQEAVDVRPSLGKGILDDLAGRALVRRLDDLKLLQSHIKRSFRLGFPRLWKGRNVAKRSFSPSLPWLWRGRSVAKRSFGPS